MAKIQPAKNTDHQNEEKLEKLQQESQTKHDDDPNTIEVAAQITLPPDGGWGWVVVAASFLIFCLNDGATFTFGSCIFRPVLTDLDLSPASVSLINSISVSSSFLVGPIISAIINRYGFRVSVMAGSAITCISFFFAFLFANYASLLIFYGLLAGLGFGMMNMSSLIVVGFYFQRLRAIAFAISVTGRSFGVVVFAPVYSHISQIVGWRYTVMLQSSFIGLCYFLAMTYRPLLSLTVVKATIDPEEEGVLKSAGSLSKINLKSSDLKTRKMSVDEEGAKQLKPMRRAKSNLNYPTAAEVIRDVSLEDNKIFSTIHTTPGPSRRASLIAIIPVNKRADYHENELERVRSLLNQTLGEEKLVQRRESQQAKAKSTLSVESDKEREPQGAKENIKDNTHLPKSRRVSILVDGKKSKRSSLVLDSKNFGLESFASEIGKKSRKGSIVKDILRWEEHVAESRPMYRDDAFLEAKPALPTVHEDAEENALDYQLKVSRVADTKDLKQRKGVFTTAFTRVLYTMLDPTFLKRKSCLCFCFSMLLFSAGFLVPMVFVTDRGRTFGIKLKDRDWFLSAIGVSGIFGRFASSFVSMKVHPLYVLLWSQLVAGVATLLSMFAPTAILQIVYCVTFGLFTAGTGTLRSVILAKLYGLENLTNTTGITFLFQGIGYLLSPPIAGALNKLWEPAAFVFSGVCLVLSAILFIPIPSLIKKEDRVAEAKKIGSEKIKAKT